MSTAHAIEVAHLIDRREPLASGGEATGVVNPAQWEALRFVARAERFSRTPAALAEYRRVHAQRDLADADRALSRRVSSRASRAPATGDR